MTDGVGDFGGAYDEVYFDEEYDYTPPGWCEHPEVLLDEQGRPPEVILNRMQVEMMHALYRGDSVISARAGWGSGKTTCIVLMLLAASGLYPGSTSVIVTDSRPRYVRVLHPAIQKWCPTWIWHARDAYWLDPDTDSKFFVVWYYRPSTKSSDQNPLEGIDVDGIAIVDECQALPAEVAKKLIGRVRSGLTTTRCFVGLPVEPAWWVDEAMKARCKPKFFPSSVNRRNLAEGWIEEAKEQLSDEEAAAMIDGKPQARVGQVYHTWAWTTWPEGNLTPDWWRYNPERMKGYYAIDPGSKKPSVLIIVEDDDPRWEGRTSGRAERPTYIIVGEVNLRRLATDELCAAVLEIAWPRAQRSEAPGPRVWIDDGVIDRAGRQTRDSDKRNTALDMSQAVKFAPDGSCIGGLGVHLKSIEDKDKTHVPSGVTRVRRLMLDRGRRRLLCTPDLYAAGRKKGSDGNSWVRAIGEYRYPDGSDSSREDPLKNGIEDPLDCARYFAVWKEWYDTPLTAPTIHRGRSSTSRRAVPQHSNSAKRQPGRRGSSRR